MRYLGGKSRLAKWIAEEAEKFAPGLPVWEPFCGGLSVSVALAKAGRIGIASDRHPALIALYRAVADGWDPPSALTEADYRVAKKLPDSDPLKAFARFGCSFGGDGGYARGGNRNYAGEARRSLRRDVPFLIRSGWVFECWDFLSQDVSAGAATGLFIYCDPPYANTSGYRDVGVFDHAAFWVRCREWSAAGSRVLVSEYNGPGRVVAERAHALNVTGTTGSIKAARVEKLFAVEA